MSKKIALITGGTSGLGEAMSLELSKNNWIVYAAGRNIENKPKQENTNYIYLDVTKEDSIKSCVNEILSSHQRIDMLINNAGIGVAAALEEISSEEFHRAFDINLFGVHRMIKEVLPSMRSHKKGLIVNISSIGGSVGLPFQGVYSSTKFALEGFTEALSMELKPFGINVCLIQPGDYKTKVHTNRTVIIPESNSPYAKVLSSFFYIINKNIEKGGNPKDIGKLIVRISRKRNPKLRYKSGKLIEKASPLIHFLAPTRLFEKILCSFYKLN